ncbi:MAG: alanine dehydrogenase [Alphaproteobacteria bacterium]|uniref:Alanine dehydrogenase n=1 Tax=Candidatus Nitrobium versatile TaxID=2884831 RepID=A0A953JC45_9BACT|nr:alanine dehydrogenase [Candidatus Nitrobium versatile]
MVIGVPKEVKKEEYRVGMTPPGIAELKRDGHSLLVETGAGAGSGFGDEEYRAAGAELMDRASLFRKADLIVKVKEPVAAEYDLLREGQILFTYLHLAPNRELTELLLRRKVTGFAYETLEKNGGLPLLLPMSEIAGRMAPLMGAVYLQKIHGGEGVLPTGTVGVKPAKTVILGAGVVGTNAARISMGIGMETVVIDKSTERLQKIDELFLGRVKTLPVTAHAVREEVRYADIVVGAVLVPGGRTPLLITKEMLPTMRRGAVIVDVSVDQGGCAETSRPTTHDSPVYIVEGVLHYAVSNMPGAYPRTSTLALTNTTLPYIRMLANSGVEGALREDAPLRSALNTYRGEIMNKALAESMGLSGI